MNKLSFRLLGMAVFMGIWCFFITYDANTEVGSILYFLAISYSLPIVYSLLYSKRYPLQRVLVFSVVEFVLYILTVSNTEDILLKAFLLIVNLFLGSFIVLFGGVITKISIKLLSPLQTYFASKNLNFSIPVLEGIISFIIGYFIISTELYQLILF